eukprot:CAMPEP_0201882812 /NCGR_PEP_ID=MMETSP0902-20130614/14596_1 /ASSEMBLY_ACC=CAM_ASM_000551 /TAXON_ID=420261 /ORGANISM="Thalassiosira antarctica, Strain CCMP982" /LENGTH=144 /DNA_ID=CAMNT_0048411437 /DNA_START=58 /DNA_END=492 /DNA_ORIENTATION=+
MKSFATAAALATLLVASTHAAKPSRKRTKTQHKSMDKARVPSDESYDPFLGLEQRKRGLTGHGAHESMSIGHEEAIVHDKSMSMSMPAKGTTVKVGTEIASPVDEPVNTPREGNVDVEKKEESGAMAIGTTFSALAAVGAVLLL